MLSMPYLPPEAIQEALARQRPQMVATQHVLRPRFQHPRLRAPAPGGFAAPGEGLDGKSVAVGAVIALGLGAAGYMIKRALS
jgi:hypothetical protein